MPSISTLEKICDGLGITMAQFFSDNSEFPNLTEQQRNILNMWENLTDEKKEKAMAYLEGLSEK